MTRRTRDQRREDYLDAGASIVADSAEGGFGDASLALSHVKLAEVAERAGVTKGAMYHVWPSQEAFWRDLLMYMLDDHQLFGADQLIQVADALPPDGVGIVRLRQYSNLLFDSIKDDPSFYVRTALFSYLGNDEVRVRLDSDFRESVDQVLQGLETAIFEMGRRPRPDVTMWDFAVSLGALLEGLCLQYRLGPDRTPSVHLDEDEAAGGPAELTLFTAAAEALLNAYTEPIEGER